MINLIPETVADRLIRFTYRKLAKMRGESLEQVAFEAALRFFAEGKREHAIRFTRIIFELDDDSWEQAQEVAETLRRRAGTDQDLAVFWLWILTKALFEEGRQKTALSILEAYCRIDRGGDGQPKALKESLASVLSGLLPTTRILLSIHLTWMLNFTDRSEDGLAVLQATAGLDDQSWEAPEHAKEALRVTLEDVRLPQRAAYLMALVLALGAHGRLRDVESLQSILAQASMGLLEFGRPLGLSGSPLAAFERVSFAQATASLLMMSGRPMEAAELLESAFGLDSDSYEHGGNLEAAIRNHLSAGFEVNSLDPFLFLGCQLCEAGREGDALKLLGALYRLEPEELADVAKVSQAIDRRCRRGSRFELFFHHVWVGEILERSFPESAHALLLEAGEITHNTEEAAEVVNSLKLFVLQTFSGGGVVGPYLEGILKDLLSRGETTRAKDLLHNYFVGVASTLSPAGRAGFYDTSLLRLGGLWLELLGRDAARYPLDFCRFILPKLRTLARGQGRLLEDRDVLLKDLGGIRRAILRTKLYWDRQSVQGEAPPNRKETLLWDLELSQRLIIERFLLTRISADGEVAPAPPDRFPWPREAIPGAGSGADLSPDRRVGTSFGLLEELSGAISPPSAIAGGGEMLRDRFPELAERLSEVTRAGVTEDHLVSLLGEQGLLLRVLFDDDGRLIWMAVGVCDGKIEILDHFEGTEGALGRLRWAVARHDARMGLASWQASSRRKYSPFVGSEALAAVDTLVTAAEKELSGEALASRRSEIEAQLAETSGSPDGWAVRWFRQATAPLAISNNGRANPGTAMGENAAELRRLGEVLRRVRQQRDLRSALEEATQELLVEVAEIWSLDPLLRRLTPSTALLCQVDDALHGIPMAYLPVAEVPLYQRVGSVRISLAPLLDLALAALDDEVEADLEFAPRLLCLSGVRDYDAALEGVQWLHWGHRQLAEKWAIPCLQGAEPPFGSVAALRGALREFGRFAAVTLCGHGGAEEAGILMPLDAAGSTTALWTGEGCNLTGADWLLLVSCSIGRAQNTHELDVEGFCVQLAAHRAKSIVACRWPVAALEAAVFANEILAQYLELLARRRKTGSDSPAGLRASALAAARAALARPASGDERPRVGLNTAAAFELYGLG